jgi:hypothetical protein
MKYILFLILCAYLGFGADEKSWNKLAYIQELGINIPPLMSYFSWLGALICFLVLTVGMTKENNISWLGFIRNKIASIASRLVLLIIVLSMMFAWPEWYFKQKVERLPIEEKDFQKIHHDISWQQFQDSLGFRALVISSSSDGAAIYFERETGRSAKVKKLLSDELNSTRQP